MILPLRDRFIRWQCRVRQEAMRRDGGRPAPGMRPRAIRADGGEIAPAITVLLIEDDPESATAAFRHIVRRTRDRRERYEAGLRLLSAAHYQYPEDFSDAMTALFPEGSNVAATLLREGRCVLEFEGSGQTYRIPCGVSELRESEPAFQATYWHNHLFNPALPPVPRVLAFLPVWVTAGGAGETELVPPGYTR